MTILLILLMNLLYAGTPAFMKLAAAEFDSSQIVFLRHTLAALAFLPIILFSNGVKRLSWKDGFRLAACGFLSFALASWLQIIGVQFSNAADGALIMGMEPALVILLAVSFLKENMNRTKKIALALALGGFFVLSMQTRESSGNAPFLGNLLFLLAVAAEASFPIWLKPLLRHYPPSLIAFYCLVCSSFCLLPFQGPELLSTLSLAKGASLGAVTFLAFGCSFVGCFIWLTCLQKMSAVLVALSWFLQPLLGCFYAVFLLGEKLTPSTWMGGLLILIALIPLMMKESDRKRPQQLTLPLYPVTPPKFYFPAFLRAGRIFH